MNLNKKKILAAKILGVGKNRIIFNVANLAEIKEAITRQDMKSLYMEGIISIRPIKGRKSVKRRKTRRGFGKIRKKVVNRKQIYVKITRKLRSYLKLLKNSGVINRELYWKIRKKIKMREFKSKASLREYLNITDVNNFSNISQNRLNSKMKKVKRELKKQKIIGEKK